MILKIIGGKWEMSMGKQIQYTFKSSILKFFIDLINILFKKCYSAIGYIPSNYVKEKEFLGLQKYEWVFLNT